MYLINWQNKLHRRTIELLSHVSIWLILCVTHQQCLITFSHHTHTIASIQRSALQIIIRPRQSVDGDDGGCRYTSTRWIAKWSALFVWSFCQLKGTWLNWLAGWCSWLPRAHLTKKQLPFVDELSFSCCDHASAGKINVFVKIAYTIHLSLWLRDIDLYVGVCWRRWPIRVYRFIPLESTHRWTFVANIYYFVCAMSEVPHLVANRK